MSISYTCKKLPDNQVIFSSLDKPRNFFKRNNGLMFKNKLAGHEAIMITGCNFIHTFFMKFSIDVIYINRKMEIKKIKKGVKPNRLTMPVFGAWSVIECTAGNENIKSLAKGDILHVSP